MRTFAGKNISIFAVILMLAIQGCVHHDPDQENTVKNEKSHTPGADSSAAPMPDTVSSQAPRVAAMEPVTFRLPPPPQPGGQPESPPAVEDNGAEPQQRGDVGYGPQSRAGIYANENAPRIYLPSEVDIQPVYPEGQAAFSRYIYDHFVMPERCRDLGINQYVKVRFVVEADGKISNVEALEGPAACPEFTREAVHVVTAAPDWTAARIGSSRVRCAVTIPLRLNEE